MTGPGPDGLAGRQAAAEAMGAESPAVAVPGARGGHAAAQTVPPVAAQTVPPVQTVPAAQEVPVGQPVPDAEAGPDAGDGKVHGPGRTLVAVYAVFAVAATSRAVVQILTKFGEAPVAYLLSALAGVVYVVATVGLSRPTALGRRLATGACAAELTGVLTVGTLSVADRGMFPDAAVWSGYGEGYFFLPVVLPVLGLWWLRHASQAATRDARGLLGEAPDSSGGTPGS